MIIKLSLLKKIIFNVDMNKSKIKKRSTLSNQFQNFINVTSS